MNERVRALNDAALRPAAEYVLYWSQMNRRVDSKHALGYAIERANELNLPVLFYEGLTCTYPFANDRLHTFLLEGVPGAAAALRRLGIGYCFYLRKRRSDPNDLVYRLAGSAALVVTDDYPVFIAAQHNSRVPAKIGVAFHAVDSSCIVPMNRFVKREWAAYTIRPKIHRLLPDYLRSYEVPRVQVRWTRQPPGEHVEVTAETVARLTSECEIDHSVPPSTCFRGGSAEARRRLEHFLNRNLAHYAEQRNDASAHATSNLSPWLHFGQISSLEVALSARDHAARHGGAADEFLEELIVRRELSFNFTRHADFTSLDSLPDWARESMRAHAADARPATFSPKQLEEGTTYDPLWNATQKELRLRGKIHGYYRMYWGKKLIEWCETYEDAFRLMIELHDKYALDGRDPNTYTSVLWCFGLHDRPWTERPVFGKLRYMSFAGMKRKTSVDSYIREMDHLERTGQDFLSL